jgi:hypothetical protein
MEAHVTSKMDNKKNYCRIDWSQQQQLVRLTRVSASDFRRFCKRFASDGIHDGS